MSCFCFIHQVQAAIRTVVTANAVSEGVEASVIYVRFKAAASDVWCSFLISLVVSQATIWIMGGIRRIRPEQYLLWACFCTIYLYSYKRMKLIFLRICSLSQCWRKLKEDHPGKNMCKFLQNATNCTVNSRLSLVCWQKISF